MTSPEQPTPERICPVCGDTTDAPGVQVCETCHEAIYLRPEDMNQVGQSPLIGRLLAGRFAMIREVATGGMGTIFEAIQMPVERRVAVKLLRADVVQRNADMVVDRFRREARVISRLRHPNTVTLYDFGESEDGQLYMAMEYIEGPTLAEAMEEGPMESTRAIAIASQIARSLEEAHRHGVVHRDLKPANVMLVHTPDGGEQVKVLDFGIARVKRTLESDTNPITLTGSLSGTPQYMSPEQIQGEEVDARADIYALGLILFEMLTGKRAVPGGHPVSVIMKQLNEHPPPLVEAAPLRSGLEGLQAVLDQAIAKSPTGRFSEVVEFRRSLEILARRQELGVLWAGANEGAGEAFALVQKYAEPFVQELVETIRVQVAAYRQRTRPFLEERVRTLVFWSIAPDPDERVLAAFMEQRLASRDETMRLPDMLAAFGCVFPTLRRWAEQHLNEQEQALLAQHWEVLEAHFWHLTRVVAACYERKFSADILPANDTLIEARIGGRIPARRTMELTSDMLSGAEAPLRSEPPEEEAGDFYANVLSSIHTGLMVVDQNTMIIRAVNPAMCRFIEMPAEDLEGRHVLDALRLIRGVEASEIINQIRRQGRLTPTKLLLRTAQGSRKWCMLRGSLYRDAKGAARGVMMLAEDVTEREVLVDSFRRYVGSEVVEDLLLTQRGVTLSGQERSVTVMFVSLGGEIITPPFLTRDLTPQETVARLNRYYSLVVEAVTRHRGMVDALVKDSVMALFGAPFAHDDDAWQAVRAAQAILEAGVELAAETMLEVRVAIATGHAVVGNVGSDERVNYTAVGEVVYRAHRLCRQAGAGALLLDENTHAQVANSLPLEKVPEGEGRDPAWRPRMT